MFLLTIASGQRCGSIHALSVEPGHLRWENYGVKIDPLSFLLSKDLDWIDRSNWNFFFQLFPPTRRYRKIKFGALFGHSDGIWIVLALSALPIVYLLPLLLPIALHLRIRFRDGLFQPSRALSLKFLFFGPFQAHDTRSVSTSWALFGVSVNKIQKPAFWTNLNSVISCYLKDVIVPEASFATASLRRSRTPTTRSGSAR